MYLPKKVGEVARCRIWEELDKTLRWRQVHCTHHARQIYSVYYTDTRAHHGRKYTVHTIYTRWEEVVIRKTGTTWGEEEE